MSITLRRIIPRIKFELLYRLNAFNKYMELRNDSNYNLGEVDKCFIDRRGGQVEDTEILNRIIKSYNLAKAAQEEAGSSFRPSNEWLPIYEMHLGEVISVLKNKDIVRLRNIYNNFFRDPCSHGLHGLPRDMKKYYFSNNISLYSKMLYLNDNIHRYRLWKTLLEDAFDVNNLSVPTIGNPYGIYIDGTFTNSGFYNHYYAVQIARLCKEIKRPTVVELGGGYGSMAYFLSRDNNNITYIDFDLPENTALTAYFMLSAFPDKNILLYGEDELNDDTIRKNNIIIMPSFECTKLPEKSVDIAFNSYSLAEMSPDTINTFISEFMRIVRGYIFHVNHNRNSVVTADHFGIDQGRFELIYKTPALWNMGLNPDSDEYEYLYKRI